MNLKKKMYKMGTDTPFPHLPVGIARVRFSKVCITESDTHTKKFAKR
jgi:hypothetical protein